MRTLIIAAALAAVAATAALAQDPAPVAGFVPGGVFALPPKERFAATDKNKDGKIVAEEMLAVLNSDAAPFVAAIMDRADANKDGWLNEAEFAPQAGGGLAGRAGGAAPGRGGPAPAAAQPK